MATPAVRALRDQFPGAHLVAVLKPYIAGVLEGSSLGVVAGSDEDRGDALVSGDVEAGGGSALSKSGGNIGAEFGASVLCAALFAFSCSAFFFLSASFVSCKG